MGAAGEVWPKLRATRKQASKFPHAQRSTPVANESRPALRLLPRIGAGKRAAQAGFKSGRQRSPRAPDACLQGVW
jgi:hypothetical protein